MLCTFRPPIARISRRRLQLREASQRLGLVRRFAECFDDFRNPEQTDDPLEQLLAQRIFGIALGYKDLNDPATLGPDRSRADAVRRVHRRLGLPAAAAAKPTPGKGRCEKYGLSALRHDYHKPGGRYQ